jgi:hypothetical protein
MTNDRKQIGQDVNQFFWALKEGRQYEKGEKTEVGQ